DRAEFGIAQNALADDALANQRPGREIGQWGLRYSVFTGADGPAEQISEIGIGIMRLRRRATLDDGADSSRDVLRGNKLKRPVLPTLDELAFNDRPNFFRLRELGCMPVEKIGGNLAEDGVLPPLSLAPQSLFLHLGVDAFVDQREPGACLIPSLGKAYG